MDRSLAMEWRRRFATRGGSVALLLAIPVVIAGLTAVGSGPPGFGGGFSAITSGPSDVAIGAAAGSPSSRAQADIARASRRASAALSPASVAPLGVPLTSIGGRGSPTGEGNRAPQPGAGAPPAGSRPAPPGATGPGGTPSAPDNPAGQPGGSLGETTSPLSEDLPDPVGNGLQGTVDGLDRVLGSVAGSIR